MSGGLQDYCKRAYQQLPSKRKFESKRYAKEQACSEQTNGVNVRLCESSFKEADQT